MSELKIGRGDKALDVLLVSWSHYLWIVAKENVWRGRGSYAVAPQESLAAKVAESGSVRPRWEFLVGGSLISGPL